MEWHLITCEYPPDNGGVSDYTQIVAGGLASAGDRVHVWCPTLKTQTDCNASQPSGVIVHSELGGFSPADLRRAGRRLDDFPRPRRLLVQWVPHGYGYRSMNLGFCFWLLHRAKRKGDEIDLMVHEPFLFFREGNWRQRAAATMHRLMTMVLLGATRRLWFSIPEWGKDLRPFALGRSIPSKWLPVCSNIEPIDRREAIRSVRSRYVGNDDLLVGHLGTYGPHITQLLHEIVPKVLNELPNQILLLIGHGSAVARRKLIDVHPDLATRIEATGHLDAHQLSLHISACDLMIQPYPDGISTRRTSAMVSLSHGRPLITTKGRVTEPLWAESRAVLLAPTGDVNRFGELTSRILTIGSRNERDRLGKAARILYEQRFHLRHMIAALRSS